MVGVWDLRIHAAAARRRSAIVCGDERLSYAELEALANRVAATFRQLGLVRGDHIASLIGNRPEALAMAWAAWRTGLYLTPLATALTPTELRHLIEDCDAKVLLADAALAELAAPLARGLAPRAHWLSLRGAIPGFTPLEPLLAVASPEPHADGYLYLTDRLDDLIISGGVNLYPQEIEAVIRQAPGVWDCAVVGVPDERFGECPVAFVVPDRGAAGADAPTLVAAVHRHCEQHLGRFKRPAGIRILDSLPRSPTGKLLRRRLRELVAPR